MIKGRAERLSRVVSGPLAGSGITESPSLPIGKKRPKAAIGEFQKAKLYPLELSFLSQLVIGFFGNIDQTKNSKDHSQDESYDDQKAGS